MELYDSDTGNLICRVVGEMGTNDKHMMKKDILD